MSNKELLADYSPRPEFSRFAKNLSGRVALPIYPLTVPSADHVGVVLVGDYIAEDLITYCKSIDDGFRKRWLVLSTTQSDAIPTDCVSVDFNFFTNRRGIPKYLASRASDVPYCTEIGDGHYVDPGCFYGGDSSSKRWDLVYPAKWYPTKNTELVVRAAKLAPGYSFAIYGWPVVSERKRETSEEYRDHIFELARGISNLDVIDSSSFNSGEVGHKNNDGSVVIGSLSKEEMRDRIYRPSRCSVFLSEQTEAINRACTEMLCCNIPMLVSPTDGGLDQLVTEKTGLMIERDEFGIVKGLEYVLANLSSFSPRAAFLSKWGKENTNIRLREIVARLETVKGVAVNWTDWKTYGGDLWTPYEIYSSVLNS